MNWLSIAATLTAGLNAQPGLHGETVSRALVLLPVDRAQTGEIRFEIESGPRKGAHRCEALGRGQTSTTAKPGWIKSKIGRQVIYYAPYTVNSGATIPGVYDARVIEPSTYEIELINSPDDLKGEEDTIARITPEIPGPRPYFTGVLKHWYSRISDEVPIDLVWSEEYQPYSQGAAFPVYENRPVPTTEAGKARQDKQLAHNPRYYFGPFGRSGFANHTDRWDDPDHQNDPAYKGRPELKDLRWRNTDGCIKVRATCLPLLDEFVAEQARLGRRVQYEVREVP